MTIEDKITREWLIANPYDPDDLPVGWERKFGLRGMFMKYDSIEHAERKNMYKGVPFGGANYMWELMKSNLQEGDELWIVGNDGEVVYIIRNESVVWEQLGKYRHPVRGHYVVLWGC